jgi:uncharacterized protein YbcI
VAETDANDESRIAEAINRYHEDQQGCVPRSVTVRILDEIVIVHSAGIYTPTEEGLFSSDEGRKLIKSARRELRSLSRREIEAEVGRILNCRVLRSFWDLDVRAGEQIEVYMIDRAPPP